MSDDNSPLGAFLGFVLLGTAAVLGYKSGQKNAYRNVADEQRDREIMDLKRQIATMRLENCDKN